MVDSQQMEPLLKCEKCPCYYRDTKSPCIVCLFPHNISLSYLCENSVSSVKTLEDAKVARGCLYMQMPVQEVGCRCSPGPTSETYIAHTHSMALCNFHNLKRFKERVTMLPWICSRNGKRKDDYHQISLTGETRPPQIGIKAKAHGEIRSD